MSRSPLVILAVLIALGAGTGPSDAAIRPEEIAARYLELRGEMTESSFLQSGDGGSDEPWSDEFGQGTDGPVYALTSYSGELVIGGDFTSAGNFESNNIARYDGDLWHDMGTGTDGPVLAVIEHASDLYAAGIFTSIDGIPASHVARWDGSAWSALGAGLNGTVYDLASFGGDLYATGTFSIAGSTSASYIARWDGSTWHDVNGGLNLHGWDFEVVGPDLYVIGAFSTAGGISSPRTARWDGAGWTALGSGPGLVDAFCGASYQGDLVVAGWGGVKRWSGGVWTELPGLDDWVYTLREHDGSLYAGGYFQNGPTEPLHRLAIWDGTNWVSSGRGADRLVRTMETVDGDLFVGGHFTKLQGEPTFDYILTDRVARFDGAN